MSESKSVFKGVVHGNNIELDSEPGLPDGQEVTIFLQPLQPPVGPADRLTARRLSGPADSKPADPLMGLRVSTGIADLSENFDDYRFGKRLS